MQEYYCSISVESVSEDSLKAFLEKEISGQSFGNISILVEDRSDIYKYTSSFMKEQNIEEPDAVIRSLDLDAFGVDIDIICVNSEFGAYILDFVTDAIGYIVSKKLNTRTLVTLSNQNTPFCLFNNGKREQVFIASNKDYFSRLFWIPSTL